MEGEGQLWYLDILLEMKQTQLKLRHPFLGDGYPGLRVYIGSTPSTINRLRSLGVGIEVGRQRIMNNRVKNFEGRSRRTLFGNEATQGSGTG